MTAVVLGIAWALVPLVVAARRASPARRPPVGAAGGTARPGGLPVLGRVPTGRPGGGRGPSSRPVPPSAVAVPVVAAAAAVAVVAPALAPLAVLPWAARRLRRRAGERRRLLRLEADLPEVVDLLALAAGAGANVRLAVAATGRRGAGPLALELQRVSAEVAAGRRLADALDDLPARAGEATRPLAAVLAGCERYGAPVVPALERLAGEVRRQRLRRAEEAARRLPVLLLFPLVLCVLPAFALLTVAPLVAGALRELRL